jgi:hypothetical protein
VEAVQAFKQRYFERMQTQAFVRRTLLEVQRSVYAKIIDLENAKIAGKAAR